MSDTTVQISNTASVRPVSANYRVSVPQPVRTPDVNLNVEQPDWAGLISKGVTAWAKGKAADEKAQAKLEADSAKISAKNDLARKALIIQERQRQGGSRTEAATAFRALQDAALAEKILDEGEVYNTVKHYAGGLLDIDEEREKYWAKANEEHLNNKVASLQSTNPQLNTMSPETVSGLLVNMQSQVDAATKLKSYMDMLPEGDAKERVKAQYSSYLQQNVYANVGIKIGNLYASGDTGSPQDVYTLQAQSISFCKQNGLTDGEAAALTNTVFDMYGLGSGYERYKKYVKDNTEFYKGVNEMMLTRAKNNILTNIDNAAYIYAAAGDAAVGEKMAIKLDAAITELADKASKLPTIGTNGKYTNTSVQNPSRDQVTAALQGMSNVSTNGIVPSRIAADITGTGLEIFNKSNTISKGAPYRDAVIAVQNSDGLRSLINIDLVQRRADLLKKSDDPEDQVRGAYIDQQVKEFNINTDTAFLLQKFANRLTKDSLASGMYYFDERSGRVSMRNLNNAGIMQQIGLAAAGIGATSDFQAMDDFNRELDNLKIGDRKLTLEEKLEIAERYGFEIGTEDTNAPVNEEDNIFSKTGNIIKDATLSGYAARRLVNALPESSVVSEEAKEAIKDLSDRYSIANAIDSDTKETLGNISEGIQSLSPVNTALRAAKNIRDSKASVSELNKVINKSMSKLVPGANLKSTEEEKPVTATASSRSSETLAYADIAQGHLPVAAQKYEVPERLLDAVFEQESNRGTDLKSKTGVEGAMQITKDTWNNEIAPELGFTKEDFYDPQKHMEGGAYYLSKQLKAFNGDEAKALAAYNGGAGTVRQAVKAYGKDWLEHIEEFSVGDTAEKRLKKGKETKDYVKNILKKVYADNDDAGADFAQSVRNKAKEVELKDQVQALSDAINNNEKISYADKQLLQAYLERLSRQLRVEQTGQLTWEDEPVD